MMLSGRSWVLGVSVKEVGEPFFGVNPRCGSSLDPPFYSATVADGDAALEAADAAFAEFSSLPGSRRAELLEAIACELEEGCDGLLERAHEETALSLDRLASERARACHQLRLYGAEVRGEAWRGLRQESAQPARRPVPCPDLRRMCVPLGPVVVFGASNFPLAYSVVGGDVASALAVGCPVVVKAHEAHPGTSEIAARAIIRAIARLGLPQGVFALLHGPGPTVGTALVKHPLTTAVAFTGSLPAGRALWDAAAARPVPIPVFAEMGSINPIFILPGAMRARPLEIAVGLAASVNGGCGQFCTKPGLVVVHESAGFDDFLAALAGETRRAPAGIALHAGIAAAFRQRTRDWLGREGVAEVARGCGSGQAQGAEVSSVLLRTDGETFVQNRGILDQENFGPVCLVVTVKAPEEMFRVARGLGGQLTATIHNEEGDREASRELTRILMRKAGRLIQNGFPTGVEVCGAMTHGGPYPATTDSRFTSVGTAALERFLRPVTFQNFLQEDLPEPLRDGHAHSGSSVSFSSL